MNARVPVPRARLTQTDPLMHDPRPRQSLERYLANRFEDCGPIDRGGDALADQDLAVARGVAEPRGQVGDRAHRRVVDVVLEADPPQCRVSLGNADAEADFVAAAAPL